MIFHILIDFFSVIVATLLTRGFFQYSFPLKDALVLPEKHRYSYQLVLLIGMVVGSLVFGTLNIRLAGMDGFAKSLLGGIAGAIFMAEIFKKIIGFKGSTGFYFIPGLCVLIIIGRVGCFVAGIADYTYGIETSLPWGVDFGDHIKRHPVQFYESFSMILFLIALLFISYKKQYSFLIHKGFYLFVLFYAGQRFLWEFLKPYPTLIASLNLFHLLAIVMMIYALIMLRRS